VILQLTSKMRRRRRRKKRKVRTMTLKRDSAANYAQL